MANRSKAIGTKCETHIVRYLLAHGFDTGDEDTKAQRIILHGGEDQGDIAVCRGVMLQSKGGHAAETASDAQVLEWLEATETQRARRGADVAALITKRKAKGAAQVGTWWAHLPGWAYWHLAGLSGAPATADVGRARPCLAHLPAVRITLEDLVRMLRRAGYGDPLEEAA